MKITKKSEYALRALIKMAINYYKGMTTTLIHGIAEQERIPQKYLERILLDLKNAGILISKRGIGGGYGLSKPPEDISLGEIIRVIEGPLKSLNYLTSNTNVEFIEGTSIGLNSVLLDVDNAISKILDNISLQEITKRTVDLIEKKQGVSNYVI